MLRSCFLRQRRKAQTHLRIRYLESLLLTSLQEAHMASSQNQWTKRYQKLKADTTGHGDCKGAHQITKMLRTFSNPTCLNISEPLRRSFSSASLVHSRISDPWVGLISTTSVAPVSSPHTVEKLLNFRSALLASDCSHACTFIYKLYAAALYAQVSCST